MKILIERANNGFIIKNVVEKDLPIEEREPENVEVIEEEEYKEEGEIVSFKNLCYVLMDRLGVSNSKHNKYQFYLKIEDQEGKELED